ncbi:hypothetical protein ACLMJK_001910 [Lecanora helva]
MAWVRPKNTKPKHRDPAEAADSLRPILRYFSAGHTPKGSLRPRMSQQQLQICDNEYDEENSSDERPDAHAFSFSRDKLIPIAPKKPSGRPKNNQSHNQPVPRQLQAEEPVVKRTRSISPISNNQPQVIGVPPIHRPRNISPSPPPPPQILSFKARVDAKKRAAPVRHHVTTDPSGAVSSRWRSATTPLDL